MNTPLVLVVDDEEDVTHILDHNLRQAGYRTRLALDGQAALRGALLEPLPDLIILDLMLPDLSGIEVCRRLRHDARTRRIPIIMLTAKGQEADRVTGFQAGADDYVVKPFFVREITLRVGAVLRRHAEDEGAREMVCGCLTLNPASHRVTVAGREVNLTPIEFRLLECLMSRPDRVQTRESLLEAVWESNPEVQTRTVNVHINRVREKLGPAGGYIRTLHGVGYRFQPPPPDAAS